MRIKKIEQKTRDFNITDAIVDGGTDLNEATFNQMQDNIEEAIGEHYSTEETFTGKYWIDGKKIYRKVINFQGLPNATTKEVPHNISNFDFPTFIYGIAFENNTTNYYPLPLQYKGNSSNYNVELLVTPTIVKMASDMDRSKYWAFVILEYTKTTD